MFRIVFYCSVSGDNYVMEFLKSLPDSIRSKTAAYFKYLEAHGHLTRRPYAAILRDKIYELRPGVGKLEPRILYFFNGNEIVLTHGFLKKTANVPNEEIERAIRIMQEYKKR